MPLSTRASIASSFMLFGLTSEEMFGASSLCEVWFPALTGLSHATMWSCGVKPRFVPSWNIAVKRFAASLWEPSPLLPQHTLMIALTCFSHCKLHGHGLACWLALWFFITMYRELHLYPYPLSCPFISVLSCFPPTVFFL